MSCTADALEVSKCLSVKQSESMYPACPRYIVTKEKLHDLSVYQFRNSSHIATFSKINNTAERLELLPERINTVCTYLVRPASANFPFMRFEFSNNIYKFMSFEPKHDLFPIILKMLKACAFELPRDNTIFTRAILLDGLRNQFSLLWKFSLHTLNSFLISVNIESNKFKLKAVRSDLEVFTTLIASSKNQCSQVC